MGMFTGLNIASSGMSASRLNMDVVSNNIANANTTRTAEGGAFRRSRTIMRPIVEQPYWKSPFLPESLNNGLGKGVRVDKIEKDMSATTFKYDPTHPDAIKDGKNAGYVEMPNVSIVTEMVDLIAATRAYEASATLAEGTSSSFRKALEIVK